MTMHDANGKSTSKKESLNHADLFDELQRDFDTLISGEELPQSKSHADTIDAVTDPMSEGASAFLSAADNDLTNIAPEESTENVNLAVHKEDLPISPDNHAAALDASNPFEENIPVHADISTDHDRQHRGSGRFITLASAIVFTVMGSIYWLTTADKEQADEVSNSALKTTTHITTEQPTTAPQPPVGTTIQPKVETSKTTVAIQGNQHNPQHPALKGQTETGKVASQRAAVEKAKARQRVVKQATEKNKRVRINQAVDNARQPMAEQFVPNQVTVIQPDIALQKTAISEQVMNVLDAAGNWVIELASVNSDKSARQYVARMRTMGIKSEAVQMRDKGKIYHHVRITGFSSKQAATKRRDALVKQLGLHNVTVEKL